MAHLNSQDFAAETGLDRTEIGAEAGFDRADIGAEIGFGGTDIRAERIHLFVQLIQLFRKPRQEIHEINALVGSGGTKSAAEAGLQPV